ncbi:hypothetical protein PG990_004140 [Apiospora arundinis]
MDPAESQSSSPGGEPHREASESTPLLTKDSAISPSRRLKRRILLLLFTFIFGTMLADSLLPAALMQVFENVICDAYYQATHESGTTTGSATPDMTAGACKIPAVQRELAMVRGYQQLMPVFAGVLCTVPYGLLAERIGRVRVLRLYGAGALASLLWVLAVCYLRFAPVRWVWLSGLFLFVGGGDPVASSVVHVMVTDVADPAARAQIFLYLHAADVVSGFFGPAVSAALMETGHTWTVLLIAVGVLFCSAVVLLQFLPETLHLRRQGSADGNGPAETSSEQTATGNSNLLTPLMGVLSSNPQALLLLAVFAPQTAARELFTVIGLQYSNAKLSLSYARGNLLLSLFQGAQGLVVLVLLPLITHFVANRLGWAAWPRDRLYAITSIAFMTCGLLVVGVASSVTFEAVGLLLVALGSCTTGLLMSLLGGAVLPSQVSAIYSAALLCSIIMRSLSGPISSGLLVAGLERGAQWIGLPFVVMAAFMTCILVASSFIKRKQHNE